MEFHLFLFSPSRYYIRKGFTQVCAEEDDQTAQVNPKQQDHDRTQRTVNKLIPSQSAAQIPVESKGSPFPNTSDEDRAYQARDQIYSCTR